MYHNFVPRNFLNFLHVPAGHMNLSVNGRRSVDSPSIATKLGAKERGKCQLSFALIFSSTRSVSAKRTISNFRSISWRATCNLQGGAIYVTDGAILEICDSSFIGNTANYVSRFCSCYLAVL